MSLIFRLSKIRESTELFYVIILNLKDRKRIYFQNVMKKRKFIVTAGNVLNLFILEVAIDS